MPPEPRIIPIFPLDLVLFPGQQLPLRIFEPRYKQLVEDCMLGDGLFGVCLADRKKNVDGWEAPLLVGTIAKITRCSDEDIAGERLALESIGRSRFRITRILNPAFPRPQVYDPLSEECILRLEALHREAGSEKKQYLRAEIREMPAVSGTVKLEVWERLVNLWKDRIISHSEREVSRESLDGLLRQYYLITDLPTTDYLYSLAALGSETPYDLQPLLEVDILDDLVSKIEGLFIR